jgi:drug/metabolite transporter (DMT)-like permease
VGAAGLRREWQAAGWTSALAGLTNISAYAIVLYTIQAGTPATYAGAVREFSVVFGAAAGVLLLRERGTTMRLAGSVCVAAGVAVIALLG